MPRPSPAAFRWASRVASPWLRFIRPDSCGWEHIPDERPLLFVGNHSILGILDLPFVFLEVYRRRGVMLRPLGDRFHFKVPLWKQLVEAYGIVEASPENADRLLLDGAWVLVLPGGARESAKRKGERYRLLWEDRVGFARTAIRHGCTIVPFATVGAEDAWDIVVDADDILRTPLRRVARHLPFPPDVIPPWVHGVGRTPWPRAERIYIGFAPPIPTRNYQGHADEQACTEVQERTRTAVEALITSLQQRQACDPQRSLGPRIRAGLRELVHGGARV